MNQTEIEALIDNPLKPNAAEWAINVREVFNNAGGMSYDVSAHVHKVINTNGTMPQYVDALVAELKILIKSSNNTECNPTSK